MGIEEIVATLMEVIDQGEAEWNEMERKLNELEKRVKALEAAREPYGREDK